jgi:hypothetical protein
MAAGETFVRFFHLTGSRTADDITSHSVVNLPSNHEKGIHLSDNRITQKKQEICNYPKDSFIVHKLKSTFTFFPLNPGGVTVCAATHERQIDEVMMD